MDGFGLSQWIRKNKTGLVVILVGSAERAAETPGELCEEGPRLMKPYEPQVLLQAIHKHLAITKNYK